MDPFTTATLDFDEITKRNVATVMSLIKLSFRNPQDGEPSEMEGQAFLNNVREGLVDNSKLICEIKRLREARQKIRDIHSPANSSDPAAPGAVCTGCSIHGSRVTWPCPTWNATEDPR